MNEEKQLQEMSDYHRKKSGFSEKDQAPPTPRAYVENKHKYDALTKRVNGSIGKYQGLRKAARKEVYNDEKKKESIIETVKPKLSFGWSKLYSDNYSKIFNK